MKKWNNVKTRLLVKKKIKRTAPKAETIKHTNNLKTIQNTGLEAQIKHGPKGKKRRENPHPINSCLAQQGVKKAVRRKRSEFKEIESLPTCREQKSHTTWQVKCKQEIKRMEINSNSTLQ